MTYCVGMLLDEGLVMAADTRTNAGVDNVGKFKKLFTWERPGEAVFVLLTAGNLAVTQAVVSMLTEAVQASRGVPPRPCSRRHASSARPSVT
jgi:putative proteasome-type protease